MKRHSAAMETESGGWGGKDSGSGFRAEAMRGMRADVREEKAGVSRVAGRSLRPLSSSSREIGRESDQQ